ncbi:MAG TPA: ABC transporter permease subunit [Caldilineae bacterium]|nr:ABC transporter permease subunit [Caldilineae bacterium]
MNIFLRELRANLKSLIIWSIIIFLLIWIAMVKFSAYASNPEMLAILDSMPKTLMDAMNMHAFNLTTLSGFFGVMFIYFGLMGAIAAGMWGSNIIAKEERNKTIEFALSLPVSRARFVTAKALAALANSIAFVLITWIASLIAMQSYNPDGAVYRFLALEMMAMFAIELIFLSIGLLVACAMKRPKRTGSIVIGIILVLYYFSMISGLHEKLDFLKYLTPFKYFDAGTLLHQGGVAPVYWALSVVIILISLTGAYYAYNRRDMYI